MRNHSSKIPIIGEHNKPTVIEGDASITVSSKMEVTIEMPHNLEEGRFVSPNIQFISAIANRIIIDSNFVGEQIAWLENEMRKKLQEETN